MKTRRKLSKNCSIHGKNREISGLKISEHPLKPIFLMFETETVGPCLVRNLKWSIPRESQFLEKLKLYIKGAMNRC